MKKNLNNHLRAYLLIVFLNILAISMATNSAHISKVSLSALAFISGLRIVFSFDDLLSTLAFFLE